MMWRLVGRLMGGMGWSGVLAVALSGPAALAADDLVLVAEGTAKATIWYDPQDGEGNKEASLADTAKMLADHLKQISGADVPVQPGGADAKPAAGAPVIVLGRAALALGCPPPPATKSGDGYRVRRDGTRLFLVGESPASTYFAASHFLETVGCRWFFDNALGTVIPTQKTIAVGALDLAEKPSFVSRSIWGPNWQDRTWGRHNRLGGNGMSTSHAWSQVSAGEFGAKHPEYFSMNGAGERKPGLWLCTSNPDVQRIFIEKISEQVRGKGAVSVSLSPPDGTSFCQCPECKKLDDPTYLEPSSGRVVMSDRYLKFFSAVGAAVQKVNPEAILCFYAYSDYSAPPRHAERAPDNICVFMAPIRYCRYHSLNNALCEPRLRLRDQTLAGWAKVVSKLGWREYNYNLAEGTVPFAKMSVVADDLPYLAKNGCIGANIECLAFWHIYGPHTYLTARLLWNVNLDAQAVMDDFYEKFCGKAAPHVKAYWERMDKAYRETDAHSGSYFSVPDVWTPALLKACQDDLAAAAKAADTDVTRARVEMFQAGLDNAAIYLDMLGAINRCDFVKARERMDALGAHMDDAVTRNYHRIGEYKRGYLGRFISPAVQGGYDAVTGANQFVTQLPDQWHFRYDLPVAGQPYAPEARAAELKCLGADFQPGNEWRLVKTYSQTLANQGIDEQLTWMWYRTEFEVKELPANRRLSLLLDELDGRESVVWLNGAVVSAPGTFGRRKPVQLDVSGKLTAGRNTVVVATNHSSISELMLGGILRPAFIFATDVEAEAKLKAEAAEKAKAAAEAKAKAEAEAKAAKGGKKK